MLNKLLVVLLTTSMITIQASWLNGLFGSDDVSTKSVDNSVTTRDITARHVKIDDSIDKSTKQSVQIVQGERGKKGDRGPRGLPGEDGADGRRNGYYGYISCII